MTRIVAPFLNDVIAILHDHEVISFLTWLVLFHGRNQRHAEGDKSYFARVTDRNRNTANHRLPVLTAIWRRNMVCSGLMSREKCSGSCISEVSIKRTDKKMALDKGLAASLPTDDLTGWAWNLTNKSIC